MRTRIGEASPLRISMPSSGLIVRKFGFIESAPPPAARDQAAGSISGILIVCTGPGGGVPAARMTRQGLWMRETPTIRPCLLVFTHFMSRTTVSWQPPAI